LQKKSPDPLQHTPAWPSICEAAVVESSRAEFECFRGCMPRGHGSCGSCCMLLARAQRAKTWVSGPALGRTSIYSHSNLQPLPLLFSIANLFHPHRLGLQLSCNLYGWVASWSPVLWTSMVWSPNGLEKPQRATPQSASDCLRGSTQVTVPVKPWGRWPA
jgi:hypothetical protein